MIGMALFISIDKHLQIKPMLLFNPCELCTFRTFPLLRFNCIYLNVYFTTIRFIFRYTSRPSTATLGILPTCTDGRTKSTLPSAATCCSHWTSTFLLERNKETQVWGYVWCVELYHMYKIKFGFYMCFVLYRRLTYTLTSLTECLWFIYLWYSTMRECNS